MVTNDAVKLGGGLIDIDKIEATFFFWVQGTSVDWEGLLPECASNILFFLLRNLIWY